MFKYRITINNALFEDGTEVEKLVYEVTCDREDEQDALDDGVQMSYDEYGCHLDDHDPIKVERI